MVGTLFLTVFLFAQAQGLIPVPQQTQSSPSTNVNVTIPAPNRADVIASQREAAPVIMESGMESLAQDGGNKASSFLSIGGDLAKLRKDLILQPRVREISQLMQRVVLISLGLVIAALALWGMIGHVFKSDATEAFEAIGHVPLWTILALSTLSWLPLLLDGFGYLAEMLSQASLSTLGQGLRTSCPEGEGPCAGVMTGVQLGPFGLIIALFYLVALMGFAIRMWTNTGFLMVAAAVAVAFVFSMVTPWTSAWGQRWFRMVPGTAGDLLVMGMVLGLAGPTMDLISGREAWADMLIRLAILSVMGMVRRLCGVDDSSSFAGRFFTATAIYRMLRNRLPSGAGAAAAASTATGARAASATTPTRAPRYGSSVTNKSAAQRSW